MHGGISNPIINGDIRKTIISFPDTNIISVLDWLFQLPEQALKHVSVGTICRDLA
jgi:hypothetical protein